MIKCLALSVLAGVGPGAILAQDKPAPIQGPRPMPQPAQASVWFKHANSRTAKMFRDGHFGMPCVLSPCDPDTTRLHMARSGYEYVFEKEGEGWKYRRGRTLPLPPAMPPETPEAPVPGEERASGPMPEGDKSSQDRLGMIPGSYGYQYDEYGIVYWVGMKGIFQHRQGQWKMYYPYPTEILDRILFDGDTMGAHPIILPKGRIAIVNGKDAFFKVLAFPEDSMEGGNDSVHGAGAGSAPDPVFYNGKGKPRVLCTIGFDTLGTCSEQLVYNIDHVSYCIADGCLFFSLARTGRFFKIRLDSWALTELEVPWVVELHGATPEAPSQWLNSGGRGTPPEPVLPEGFAFSPRPDGKVHIRALLTNLEPAVYSVFDLDHTSVSAQCRYMEEREMEDPRVIHDKEGNLLPIRKMVSDAQKEILKHKK